MASNCVTGADAGRYVRAFMCNPRGVNSRALTRDALNACRSKSARRRLSLAAVSRRTTPVVSQPQVWPGAARETRPQTLTARPGGLSAVENAPPRLGALV